MKETKSMSFKKLKHPKITAVAIIFLVFFGPHSINNIFIPPPPANLSLNVKELVQISNHLLPQSESRPLKGTNRKKVKSGNIRLFSKKYFGTSLLRNILNVLRTIWQSLVFPFKLLKKYRYLGGPTHFQKIDYFTYVWMERIRRRQIARAAAPRLRATCTFTGSCEFSDSSFAFCFHETVAARAMATAYSLHLNPGKTIALRCQEVNLHPQHIDNFA